MANLGVNDNGARRCWFWNLAPPKRFRLSWLYLDRCISLAWTAVRSLVYCSVQGSVRCHISLTSTWQRLLLSVICLLGAAVCAVGVYLWRLWPEEWQAGLVFILFGLLVLAPATIKEIQFRRKALAPFNPSD
jgi:di/tricarboxylate transporter